LEGIIELDGGQGTIHEFELFSQFYEKFFERPHHLRVVVLDKV
jgi:hypothetical protein